MSKNKRADGVSLSIYKKFLYGDDYRFLRNSAREASHILRLSLKMHFQMLAMARFEWRGLPKTVDPVFMEKCLFTGGLSVFYKSDKYGFLALKGSGAYRPNMYDTPQLFKVTGNSYVNETLSTDDCVPIWNNTVRMPDAPIAEMYAERLSQIDLTLDINVKQLRRTRILLVNDNTRLSVENLNRMIDEGDGAVRLFEDEGLGESIAQKVANIDLGGDPDQLTALHIMRTRLYNEACGMLGIKHSNQDKKERVVSAEVGANDEEVEITRSAPLQARKEAARIINERYGLNVSVDYRVSDNDASGGSADPKWTQTSFNGPGAPVGNSNATKDRDGNTNG